MYGWIITRDLLAEEDGFPSSLTEPCPGNETGQMGPYGISTAPGTIGRRLLDGEGEPFRMLDDDDIPYYEGRLLMDVDGRERECCDSSFAPLDDFGAGNAGCTSIQYRVNGEWETI